MGYTTTFRGRIEIQPPLNEHEIKYLKDFAGTRRMNRNLGPYFTDTGDGDGGFLSGHGQSRREDIIDYNSPFPGDDAGNLAQPGLWCQWVPTDDGTALVWDGVEKFYHSREWMEYIIHTFLRPGCTVYKAGFRAPELRPAHWIYPPEFDHFTFDHVLNGVIEAQGEEYSDRWDLVVTDNVVTDPVWETDPGDEDEDTSWGYDEKAWATTLGPKPL